MTSFFLFGLALGVRHAFDADHLAAVASLATRSRSLKSGIWQGVAWGFGHTLTLLLVGGTCLAMGRAIPERWAAGLELVVGLMLLVLGLDVLWRIRRQRVHVHVHRHGDGTRHWHAHQHASQTRHDAAHHEHMHPARLPARALAVGLVHGLAGSAALLLITLEAAPSLGAGLACIGLFGLGSILGMAALSAVVAVPLQAASHLVGHVQNGLEALVGAVTVLVGARVVYQVLGFAAGH